MTTHTLVKKQHFKERLVKGWKDWINSKQSYIKKEKESMCLKK